MGKEEEQRGGTIVKCTCWMVNRPVLIYSIPLPIKTKERTKKGDKASQRELELWSEMIWEGWTFSTDVDDVGRSLCAKRSNTGTSPWMHDNIYSYLEKLVIHAVISKKSAG